MKRPQIFSLLILLVIGACSAQPSDENQTPPPQNNSILSLPDGFRAVKVADSLGSARHIAIAQNGDIYIGLRHKKNDGGIVALRDTNSDGQADIKKYFGAQAGTGIGLHNGYLYHSSTTAVYRYKMGNQLVPSGSSEEVITGFPEQGEHAPKAFTFDDTHIYVNVGAPSNSCQEQDRAKESPGQDPCPLLEKHAGIWQFDASQTGQTQQDGVHYATGLRNVMGLDWNDAESSLYVMQHGRDQLYQNWPDYYTKKEGAELPAEEFFQVDKGDNFGWPYSYYDQRKNKIMLAPEYGGDGQKTIADSKYAGKFKEPIMAFPGHWAPDDLIFYTSDQFPTKYQHGAFIAFHGSWNRAPQPQEGYKVEFVAFNNGSPKSDATEFATGFPQTDQPQPGSAKHRPTGLDIGPHGALYVTDDSGGTVWKIMYGK